jgi:hypothetical protein
MEKDRKCPFDKKSCKEGCVLYRKGLRYFDTPDENGKIKPPIPFEECAINIGVDCLENLIGRAIGQQKATEQARNEMAAVKELFYVLASRKALAEKIEAAKREDVIEVIE